MVSLNEDFKPDGKYTVYLLLATLALIIVIWAAAAFWLFIPDPEIAAVFGGFGIIAIIILVVCLVFACIWAPLYYKSVVYQLTNTEMTWKRGVFFRKTGIVPYDRITNVDIVQGPVMRLFGISHLRIDTAGAAANNAAKIQLEGIKDPEPLRQMLMDFVRGNKPASAATGTKYAANTAEVNPDMKALLDEVAAIRRLLEERK